MELRELNTFITIVRCGAFSSAARELGYSQSAVTVQVKNLEQALRVRLFDRIGRKAVLTEQGRVFYEHAVRIFGELSAAEEALKQKEELTGSFSLGTINSIGSSILAPILKRFRDAHPRVRVSITTDTPRILIELLSSGALDAVFLLDERIYDARFVKAVQREEKVRFVVSHRHPLANRTVSSIRDLLSWPFILTEEDASYRRVLDARTAGEDIRIFPVFESNSTDLILEMLSEREEEISFLPEYVVQEGIDRGSLGVIEVPGYNISVWLQFLYHRDHFVSREMREALHFFS